MTRLNRRVHARSRRLGKPASGFTLIEALLAIFILAIGVVSVAALFPAGIAQQRRSTDDVMGPVVANSALGILRSKLRPELFGTLKEGTRDIIDPGMSQNYLRLKAQEFMTVSGDWAWVRPGLILNDNPSTDIDERGAIDIFNLARWTHSGGGTLEEFTSGNDPVEGVPYSLFQFGPDVPPTVDFEVPPVITRAERTFPSTTGLADKAPQYYWDCMFRRYEGRVQVAIFVYRIALPPSEKILYTIPTDPVTGDAISIPYRLKLVDDQDLIDTRDAIDSGMPVMAWPDAWDSFGCDDAMTARADDRLVPGAANPTFDPDPSISWQVSGQWLLDQNGNIHRVIRRLEQSSLWCDPAQSVVELRQPIPEAAIVNQFPALSGTWAGGFGGVNLIWPEAAAASSNIGVDRDVVTDLWYVPQTVIVGGVEAKLTPIYVTVQEL